MYTQHNTVPKVATMITVLVQASTNPMIHYKKFCYCIYACSYGDIACTIIYYYIDKTIKLTTHNSLAPIK